MSTPTRDELAAITWRTLEPDSVAQGVTWENNYARDQWYAVADAILAAYPTSAECATCRGTGIAPDTSPFLDDEQPCPDCAAPTGPTAEDERCQWWTDGSHRFRCNCGWPAPTLTNTEGETRP